MTNGRRVSSGPSNTDQEQLARMEQRLQRVYAQRQKRLLLARAKGPTWYITRTAPWLVPWIALLLTPVVWALGSVTTLPAYWVEATNISWLVGAIAIAVIAALVLSCVFAAYLWRRARLLFFPLLPPDEGSVEKRADREV